MKKQISFGLSTTLFLSILGLSIFITSCQKEDLDKGAFITSKYFTEKNWDELSNEVTDSEELGEYLQLMFNESFEKKDFTYDELLKIGDPSKNLNLLAALSISENFDYTSILWEEKSESENNEIVERGTTYRKRIGNNSYYSFWCLGVKVDADVWWDAFNGGCNPSYYVNKRRKKVCLQSINCP